ncbi:unnamed protein product [Lactuca saligna]|uniref:Uncharacterized protein n=1 Tax=Lactuca saligna TaxID=75948 RepID=A0AA36EN78_LACSI|nr:unnamed protein product [Lactuca saligna]
MKASEKRHDATLRDQQAFILSIHTQVGHLTKLVQEKLLDLLSRKVYSIHMAQDMDADREEEDEFPYQPPLSFLSCARENLVKQGNTMFMQHKELKEKLEKEEKHLKPLMSTPMIFEVFAFTRPPDQVTKVVEEKEEEYDEPHFDKRNPERDKTKAKDMGMRKEPKRKHKEDVNPTM